MSVEPPTTVREMMQSRVITISPEATLPEIQRRFADARIGAMPVVDRDRRLEGIVSRFDVMRRYSVEQSLAELADSEFDQILGIEDRDDSVTAISAAVGQRMGQMHARDIMMTDVITINPDASSFEAAEIMADRRIHRLPVVEDGRMIGIVSAFDFLRLHLRNATEA